MSTVWIVPIRHDRDVLASALEATGHTITASEDADIRIYTSGPRWATGDSASLTTRSRLPGSSPGGPPATTSTMTMGRSSDGRPLPREVRRPDR